MQQSNIVQVGDGTGGVTEAFKDRFMMAGPFNEIDVVWMVNRKFIPLRIYLDNEARDLIKVKLSDVVVPGILFLDHEGNVVAIEGIARNVSKRVRIESALRESEQRLQNVLRSMIDPLFVLDTNGVVQVVNPAVEALLGHPPRDLIGMPLQKLILDPPGDGVSGPLATLRPSRSTV
jgi:PAS domain-containing protein